MRLLRFPDSQNDLTLCARMHFFCPVLISVSPWPREGDGHVAWEEFPSLGVGGWPERREESPSRRTTTQVEGKLTSGRQSVLDLSHALSERVRSMGCWSVEFFMFDFSAIRENRRPPYIALILRTETKRFMDVTIPLSSFSGGVWVEDPISFGNFLPRSGSGGRCESAGPGWSWPPTGLQRGPSIPRHDGNW